MPALESVDTTSDESSDRYGWDWSATTHDVRGSAGSVKDVAADLIRSLGGGLYLPAKGLQGWAESVQVYDADGFRLGAVYFGGDRTDVHVVSTSAQADAARRAVAGKYAAKTSRVDTRVDTDRLTFEQLTELALSLGGRGTKVTEYVSHTLSGNGEKAEAAGRTLYVGSPSSMVRVRIYEKWLEAGKNGAGEWIYEEGTNRVEVQLRPPSRGKRAVSGWSPAETFCASRLTQRLAERLGEEVAMPGSLQKSKGTPDLEKQLHYLGVQYGPAFSRWMANSGGDLGTVLDHLEAHPDKKLGEGLAGTLD